jgi:hypothetical protein
MIPHLSRLVLFSIQDPPVSPPAEVLSPLLLLDYRCHTPARRGVGRRRGFQTGEREGGVWQGRRLTELKEDRGGDVMGSEGARAGGRVPAAAGAAVAGAAASSAIGWGYAPRLKSCLRSLSSQTARQLRERYGYPTNFLASALRNRSAGGCTWRQYSGVDD